ncbi:MAG: HEAT repeat domain-containing protein [Elusimicrobia bacterium]|nr:HEAT repeat domain-containing protein [Elusimicrobiota bacterium]
MLFSGCAVPFQYARARCGTLLLAASFLACAFSYTRAQAPAAADPVAALRERIVARDASAKSGVLAAAAAEGVAPRRAALVALLGNLPAGRLTLSDVRPFLADPDAGVRNEAVTVCGRVGGAAAARALEGVLRSDPVESVRLNAALWLGGLRDAASAAPLGDALAADADPNVRAAAVHALRRLGGPGARTQLGRAKAEKDRRVRKALDGK